MDVVTVSDVLAARQSARTGAFAWGLGVRNLCGVDSETHRANCHRLPHSDGLHSDGLSVWETP